MNPKPVPYSVYKKLSPSQKKAVKKAASRKSYGKRIYGRGNYFTDMVKKVPWKRMAKSAGRAALTTGLNAIPVVGGVASKLGGSLYDMILGNGDYQPASFSVRNNSFMDRITVSSSPRLNATSMREVRIHHREFISDIVTSENPGEFKLQNFQINPGLPNTFPWLSSLAQNFQQYEIKGMLFEFVSTSSDALNSTNTQLGQVIMCTNYNSAEPNFASKQQMLQTEFCSAHKPSQSFLHPIECKPSLTTIETLYIRTGDIGNNDIKFYDLGNMQIATLNCQGEAVNLGELYVDYDIVFKKPILSPTASVQSYSNFYHSSTGFNLAGGNYFGTTVEASGNNLDLTLSSRGVTFLDAIKGESYLIHCSWIGSSTASVVLPTVTTSNGCELKSIFQDYATPTAGNQASLTTTTANLIICVEITISATQTSQPQFILSTSGTVLPASPTSFDLLITKINPLIESPSALSKKMNQLQIEDESEDEEESDLEYDIQHIPPVIVENNKQQFLIKGNKIKKLK